MEQPYYDIHTHHPHYGVISPRMAGIHPWDAAKGLSLPDFTACDIIGETGLDYACGVSREAQERVFREHLLEAERLSKPIVLHVVKAFEETMRIVGDFKIEGVVFHGFIGSKQQAARAIERGYYLSYGQRSLRSPRTCEAIEVVPLDRLFVETDDDPNLAIATLYEEVARLKRITPAELLRRISNNYKRLFQITTT